MRVKRYFFNVNCTTPAADAVTPPVPPCVTRTDVPSNEAV